MELNGHRGLLFMIIFGILTGYTTGENVTLHYHASGVILNHNYTEEYFKKDLKDCETCKQLAADVKEGFWKMFNFFVSKVKVFEGVNSTLLHQNSEGVFFRAPSHGGPEINSTKKIVINTETQNEETGIYFVIVIRLDFNVSDPSKNLHGLKEMIKNVFWDYLRSVNHFQLCPNVLLNRTSLQFEEIPASAVTNYLEILRQRFYFTSNKILRKLDDIPDKHKEALSAISYVGCTLSAAGLTLLILTICLSRKLRRLRQNQILIYLSMSLLAAILLFTFGINGITDSDSLDLCKAIASLLHYFLLSSIVWMSIEAYNLYQDLVKVFDTTLISQNEFMCRAGVVGWIIPAIVVVITVLAEPDSYGFHVMDKNNNETLCWMGADAFYGAFLAPVLLLMTVNIIIFLVVMKEIYNIPHMCEKANRLSHFRATVSVFVLLGLNWLFAGLAATVGTLVLHYLFTITCSFQGLFIFLLHGIIKKDFQDAWRLFTTKNRVIEMFRNSTLGTSITSMSFSSHKFLVCGTNEGTSNFP